MNYIIALRQVGKKGAGKCIRILILSSSALDAIFFIFANLKGEIDSCSFFYKNSVSK